MYPGASLQVNLLVPDVCASVEFYQRVFGFEFKGYFDPEARAVVREWTKSVEPDYAELRAGESRIGLRPSVPPSAAPASASFALTVKDARAHYEHVRAAGGNATAPARQPWGAILFSVTDANGFEWSFVEA